MGSISISKVKIALISAGVLSFAVAMKLSAPAVMYFCHHQVPDMWSSLAPWLRPPYLYLVINCIIVTIVASSRFHNKHERGDFLYPSHRNGKTEEAMNDTCGNRNAADPTGDYSFDVIVAEETIGGNSDCSEADGGEDSKNEEDELLISRSTWEPPKRVDLTERAQVDTVAVDSPTSEKPLVSTRFEHRRPAKSSPAEGCKALRVTKPKRHETLENTWKTITEGRPMPLMRHLKKSESFWENNQQGAGADPAMKKSKTFRDRTNQQDSPSPPSSSGKLRKEPSLSHDDLNRRVEAFIKKFNDEMRMQRQESLNQYHEMISRRDA